MKWKTKMNMFLITVVCAAALMTASTASASNYVWEDPTVPFKEMVEVCSRDPIPDTISFDLPPDFDKAALTVRIESDSWYGAGSKNPKGFQLFTPWLGVNGKDIMIPADYSPAEQTVKVNKAGKYLKPGERNEISFSFEFDSEYYCTGTSCEGCRYWVHEIFFE